MIKRKGGPRPPKSMKAEAPGRKIFIDKDFLECRPNLGVNNLVVRVGVEGKQGC